MKSKQSLKELLYDIRRIEEHRETLTNEKIEKIYKSLQKNLNAFLADEYLKYADADGRFYFSYLDAANKKAAFLNEIVKNVDSVTPEIKKELTTLVDKVYTESYRGMLTALQTAEKDGKFADTVKDLSVQKDVLNQAVNNNISKLTLPQVLEKHRAEIIYQIQQELNIGLMLGDRYENMAKRISERIGVSKSKAMNITRTETHRNIEGGFMDCAENIQSSLDGYGVVYTAVWHNMGDERVRPQVRRKTKHGWKTYISHNGANHIQMEGQIVKVGDLFDLGDGYKTKKPGHSGNAADDCNCRCFLDYKLMTAEEYEKATGKNVIKQRLSGDEEQYSRYKKILGDNAPKTLDDFVKVKYNNPDEWKKLKSLVRSKNYLQHQLPYIYNGEKLFIPNHTVFSSSPKTIAGYSSDKEIRIIDRLVDTYGGTAEQWTKKVAKIKSDKYIFDVHWYECDNLQYEMKLKYRKERTK